MLDGGPPPPPHSPCARVHILNIRAVPRHHFSIRLEVVAVAAEQAAAPADQLGIDDLLPLGAPTEDDGPPYPPFALLPLLPLYRPLL